MSNVKLVWTTPNGESLMARMARVSNPSNQNNDDTAPELLQYLVDHKHFSPLEMANAVMEIETTRDISRQILRHRSFSFQEFSQRYAEAHDSEISEARLQDHKNRQNSIEVKDDDLQSVWELSQRDVLSTAMLQYQNALAMGIAKEVARKILPEGLMCTRMYMNGTIRSWLHYLQVRLDPSTQKEHREIAIQARNILVGHYPNIFKDV